MAGLPASRITGPIVGPWSIELVRHEKPGYPGFSSNVPGTIDFRVWQVVGKLTPPKDSAATAEMRVLLLVDGEHRPDS